MRIEVGTDAENPVDLMSHDWHTDNAGVPWHQRHVEQGLVSNGFWSIEVAQAGTYEVSLFRWPDQEDLAMESSSARIKLDSHEASKALSTDDTEAVFEVELDAGPNTLQTWLTNQDGEEYGAYFVKVRRL